MQKTMCETPPTIVCTEAAHKLGTRVQVNAMKVGLTSSPNTLRATLAEPLIAHVPNMLLLFAIPCPLAAAGHTLIAKKGNGWGIVEVPKIWPGNALETLFWDSLSRCVLD